jgi:hypothetical protein
MITTDWVTPKEVELLYNKPALGPNGRFVEHQVILKGEVSLYRWPPVRRVWNQLFDHWHFLFLCAKQTNPNQSNRRSTVQWYFPLKHSLLNTQVRFQKHNNVWPNPKQSWSHLKLQMISSFCCNKPTADMLNIWVRIKEHTNVLPNLPQQISTSSCRFGCDQIHHNHYMIGAISGNSRW